MVPNKKIVIIYKLRIIHNYDFVKITIIIYSWDLYTTSVAVLKVDWSLYGYDPC